MSNLNFIALPKIQSSKRVLAGQINVFVSNPRKETAIEVVNLSKTYANKVEAVKNLSFEVERGEIFGLIGPDGAGKTSTFQILGGVMSATSGDGFLFDEPPSEARRFTGYLTQSFSLYQDFKRDGKHSLYRKTAKT